VYLLPPEFSLEFSGGYVSMELPRLGTTAKTVNEICISRINVEKCDCTRSQGVDEGRTTDSQWNEWRQKDGGE